MSVRAALTAVIKSAPIPKGPTPVLVTADLSLVQMENHALVCYHVH